MHRLHEKHVEKSVHHKVINEPEVERFYLYFLNIHSHTSALDSETIDCNVPSNLLLRHSGEPNVQDVRHWFDNRCLGREEQGRSAMWPMWPTRRNWTSSAKYGTR